MDIHKPKAAHSWREFLIEIGTIVCGILIALGLEQLVVRTEWAHKVHAAKDAMREELLWDDGPEVYQRVVMHDCLIGRLDEIRQAIEEGKPRADLVGLIRGYNVTFVSYDTRARDDASHDGVTDHLTVAERKVWDSAYDQMPYMERTNADEAAAIGHLRAIQHTGGALTEAERARVLDSIEQLRVLEIRMWGASTFTLPNILLLGPIDPTRKEDFLNAARRWYGSACVKDLPPDGRLPMTVDPSEIR